MSTPAPRKAPAPICPPAQVGPCARCGQPTHRYGPGGGPLCPNLYPKQARQRAAEQARENARRARDEYRYQPPTQGRSGPSLGR